MIIFPLKKHWYEKIKSGKKTVEYREVKPYWESRLWHAHCLPNLNPFVWDYKKEWSGEPRDCLLQCGYDQKLRLSAKIIKVEIVDGKDTDLAIDKPVYAIHLSEIQEQKI